VSMAGGSRMYRTRTSVPVREQGVCRGSRDQVGAGRQLCIAAYDLSPSLSTYCSYADDWNFVARIIGGGSGSLNALALGSRQSRTSGAGDSPRDGKVQRHVPIEHADRSRGHAWPAPNTW
jgi:hypothetical protein